VALELLVAKNDKLEGVQQFFYRHPSEVLNTIYATGGIQLLRSGLQHGRPWDAASGALVATGGLAGLLIPEKARDPDHPASNPIEAAWQWVREKPLRVSGLLYQLNNVTLGMSVLNEYRKYPQQRSWVAKLVTLGAYSMANGLLSITSKSNSLRKA